MPRAKRLRYQWKFWLDANKDEQLLLCEKLDELKNRRQFAPTIRNALKLFFDLSKGNTKILQDLFPSIVDKIKESVQIETQASNEFSQIIKQQAQLIEMMATQTTAPATVPQLPASIDTSELPSVFTTDKIEISSREVRVNFASAMGDLFAEDNEDIWS
jgi:hypothetical protein